MKKALIIFAIGLSLIVGGGLITATELSKWNTTDKTFEEAGYKTKSTSVSVDISKMSKESIIDYGLYDNRWDYNYYGELGSKVILDDNQTEGSLSYELIYYPDFGECEIFTESYTIDDDQYSNHGHHRYDGPRHHNSYQPNLGDDSDKIYLELRSSCYRGHMQNNFFSFDYRIYEQFKEIMKIKKLPVNLQQAIITINPKDEYKLVK